MPALRDLIRSCVRPMYRGFKSAEHVMRHSLGWVESESKLVQDAQTYWNESGSDGHKYTSHWRGGGAFEDENKWLSIGRAHLQIFERFARAVDLKRPMTRIVEWGCGGGANAVHFAQHCDEFVGVDLCRETLHECGRQLERIDFQNFRPILIEAANPEAALARLPGPADLFLCTYVFELLPTADYGYRLLKIAKQTLRPGGLAMIQIKYPNHSRSTASRRWNYARNLANNVSYPLEEFWIESAKCGLQPVALSMLPKVPELHDERYAYFALAA